MGFPKLSTCLKEFPEEVRARFVYTGEQRSEKWFEERKNKITASRAYGFVKSRASFEEKVKNADKSLVGCFPPSWGIRNETRALQAYLAAQSPGTTAWEVDGVFRFAEAMQSTPDAIVRSPLGELRLVEIKCPYSPTRWPAAFADVPLEYVFQCAVQMFTTGIETCDLVFWRGFPVLQENVTDDFFNVGMELFVVRMVMTSSLHEFMFEVLFNYLMPMHVHVHIQGRPADEYKWKPIPKFDWNSIVANVQHVPNEVLKAANVQVDPPQ